MRIGIGDGRKFVVVRTMSSDTRLRGIGIRIEDDVLVTAEGHEVLSRDVPRDIAEIEALMAEASDSDD